MIQPCKRNLCTTGQFKRISVYWVQMSKIISCAVSLKRCYVPVIPFWSSIIQNKARGISDSEPHFQLSSFTFHNILSAYSFRSFLLSSTNKDRKHNITFNLQNIQNLFVSIEEARKDTVLFCSSNVIPAYACAQRGTCFLRSCRQFRSRIKIQDCRISNSLSVHILYVLYIHWSKAKYGFLSKTKRCHQTNTIQNNTLLKRI